MNGYKYNWILYFIAFVIIGTIGIQIYWNYKNYEVNKRQLLNEVQASLDNAIESYYVNLAQKTHIGRSLDSIIGEHTLYRTREVKNLLTNLDSLQTIALTDSANSQGISIFLNTNDSVQPASVNIFNPAENDTVFRRRARQFAKRVIVSLTRDPLALTEIDSLLKLEFARKKIDVPYRLSFKAPRDTIRTIGNLKNTEALISTRSKSGFLRRDSFLKIDFTNATKVILNRMLSSILISLVLILGVITCLFYLLKIINKQKQLAEMKNDLINNITHEFKTPIATIGVALESMKDFNVLENKERAKEYVQLSNQQLGKLNTMVEKLLETASLDSNLLKLNKEEIDIVGMITSLVNKHQLATDKSISISAPSNEILLKADVFHFENAINNVLDNAVKYGGNTVQVRINKKEEQITLTISDNGTSLTQKDAQYIFDKFYRVSTGNTHDVKGFGIGLYYTKKIIEKHDGAVDLELETDKTTFKITLPNA
ncbi:MAG: ATP-binding protein [Flavobacteriaceae bacterium]|nr:ATP-binding protein [Flavobacteriaceae bacterium]